MQLLTFEAANTSVIVVAPRYLDELKRLPDDVLSMEDAIAQASGLPVVLIAVMAVLLYSPLALVNFR
jgi:hypothetical protein